MYTSWYTWNIWTRVSFFWTRVSCAGVILWTCMSLIKYIHIPAVGIEAIIFGLEVRCLIQGLQADNYTHRRQGLEERGQKKSHQSRRQPGSWQDHPPRLSIFHEYIVAFINTSSPSETHRRLHKYIFPFIILNTEHWSVHLPRHKYISPFIKTIWTHPGIDMGYIPEHHRKTVYIS